MMEYDPRDWYWIIKDDPLPYSSARGSIAANDAAFLAWKSAGGIPTNIASKDELGAVLADASVRPIDADMLDRFKGSQADMLTPQLSAKIHFNHENRLRALEGKQPVTANQFRNALKAML